MCMSFKKCWHSSQEFCSTVPHLIACAILDYGFTISLGLLQCHGPSPWPGLVWTSFLMFWRTWITSSLLWNCSPEFLCYMCVQWDCRKCILHEEALVCLWQPPMSSSVLLRVTFVPGQSVRTVPSNGCVQSFLGMSLPAAAPGQTVPPSKWKALRFRLFQLGWGSPYWRLSTCVNRMCHYTLVIPCENTTKDSVSNPTTKLCLYFHQISEVRSCLSRSCSRHGSRRHSHSKDFPNSHERSSCQQRHTSLAHSGIITSLTMYCCKIYT